jgi:hypothetical protein
VNTTLACTTSLVAISSVVLCWFGGSGNEAGAGCVELEVGLAAQSAFLCNFVQSVSGMTVFINVSYHWKGGRVDTLLDTRTIKISILGNQAKELIVGSADGNID